MYDSEKFPTRVRTGRWFDRFLRYFSLRWQESLKLYLEEDYGKVFILSTPLFAIFWYEKPNWSSQFRKIIFLFWPLQLGREWEDGGKMYRWEWGK